MDADLKRSLMLCQTDIQGALQRFCNDEALYVTCLKTFLSDNTMAALDEAVAAKAWDDAFTAAHALKGLAGNMGFVPLFHAAAELVVIIRAGRIPEVEAASREVGRCYREIASAIRKNTALA